MREILYYRQSAVRKSLKGGGNRWKMERCKNWKNTTMPRHVNADAWTRRGIHVASAVEITVGYEQLSNSGGK